MTAYVDLTHCVERFSDRERLECVGVILKSIDEDGTIEKIRALVNDPKWDDQPPKGEGE